MHIPGLHLQGGSHPSTYWEDYVELSRKMEIRKEGGPWGREEGRGMSLAPEQRGRSRWLETSPEPQRNCPRYTVRPEHTWQGGSQLIMSELSALLGQHH